MSTSFPAGAGNGQSSGIGRMVIKDTHSAVVDNEPESDGSSDFPRPLPADPGGDNCAGWVKTKDYGDGYYGGDEGPWRQV